MALVLAATLEPAQAAQAQPVATAPNAPPPFDVLEYEIEGNTVLSVFDVERAVLPHLGPGKGMAAVEAARDALEQAYQKGGWLSVVVDVPEQRVDAGLVRLRVTEGRVEQLRVTGARYFSQGWIRRRVPELAPGQVPNFTAVQAQLATVNRSEERRVQPVLRPGRSPGTLEAELRVRDELPLSGDVELTNRHARDTVSWRLSTTLRYANLWQREHVLALTLSTAPEDTRQAQVAALNYSLPADDGGLWMGYLVLSDSLVEPLGTAVIGKGSTTGLRRALPLSALGRLQQTLTLGVDYKDLRQRTVVGSDEISSPLRYLPLMMSWSGQLTLPGSRGQGQVTTSWNPRSLLARSVDCAGLQQDQFACSRRNADGGFAVLRADWRHAWKLGASGWGLEVRAAGQVASGPLVSAEQFALGGADTVRGYLESALSADRAWLGQVAVRSADLAPALGAWRPQYLRELVASLWLDGARGELIDPAIGQAARTHLAGAGLGLQWRLGSVVNGQLELGWPLRRSQALPERGPRAHARVQWRF